MDLTSHQPHAPAGELERLESDVLAAMMLACLTAGLAGSAARGKLGNRD